MLYFQDTVSRLVFQPPPTHQEAAALSLVSQRCKCWVSQSRVRVKGLEEVKHSSDLI